MRKTPGFKLSRPPQTATRIIAAWFPDMVFPPSNPLPCSFYARPTLDVAQDLLGKLLVRFEADGSLTTAILVEVEAYIGEDDLACHARAGRTRRNAPMYGPPGTVYIYFTYGMHWMLNAVTEAAGSPAAVLLRGALPQAGIERMRIRRSHKPDHLLSDGPAKLCQAFAIDRAFNQTSLCAPHSPLSIHEGLHVAHSAIHMSPRIGLNSVPEPWKSIPWRFVITPDALPIPKITESQAK